MRNDETVPLPLDAARALFLVYETWWHKVGMTDPGEELISDGVKLSEVAGLIDFADNEALDDACTLVEPHETTLRELLRVTTRPNSEIPADDA